MNKINICIVILQGMRFESWWFLAGRTLLCLQTKVFCFHTNRTCTTVSTDSEFKVNFVCRKKINKTVEHHLIVSNYFHICKSKVKYPSISTFQDGSLVNAWEYKHKNWHSPRVGGSIPIGARLLFYNLLWSNTKIQFQKYQYLGNQLIIKTINAIRDS